MLVRGRAISEWECGTIQPKLGNLIEWSGRLHYRFVVLGQDGEPLRGPSIRRPGEAWEHFERRRLASPLRNRRMALGLSQTDLGRLVGVSKDSVQRWELACVPPRPIAHVVWAQKLGYALGLWRVRSQRGTRICGSCRDGGPQMADSETRRRPGRPGGF
ncbi:helix-turn-helix domain-containing protein [Catenulispora sp. MAP5-51]|uniref:helix-turn-helix domain-containing protein n=1 Tax=Catenulispora sp. MAP5-51 TaxID=3156298 RepID=UPI0035191EEE